MDEKLDLKHILRNLWQNNSQREGRNRTRWLHFFHSFFNRRIRDISDSFINSIPSSFIVLGMVDNFLLLLFEEEFENNNHSNNNEYLKFIKLRSLKGYAKIIIFHSFYNIELFYIPDSEQHIPTKIVKFSQGEIPEYFHYLIDNSRSCSPKELITRITDLTALENNYISSKILPKVEDEVYRKKILVIYTLISIVLSRLKNANIFFDSYLKKTSKKDYSVSEILSIIEEQYTKFNLEVQELAEINNFLSSFLKEDLSINMWVLKKLSNKYPFSFQEPSINSLEVAITPYTLSKVVEKSFSPNKFHKKTGKFYTQMHDADFIVYLSLYRFISQKNHFIDLNDAFNLLYHFNPSNPDYIKINEKMPLYIENVEILDPACGSGTFLFCITRLIYQLMISQHSIQIRKVTLWGIDLDFLALFVTKLRLLLFKIAVSTNKGHLPFVMDLNNIRKIDFFRSDFNHNFDLIIGNPPYVRHEDITYNNNLHYKNFLQKHMKELIGNRITLDKKSDLYIYFCLKGLTLLKKTGGILAFLTSNAWLEVRYGKTLQNFILSPNCKLRYIEVIFRGGGRLWEQIGINTVIFIAQKMKEEYIELNGVFSRSKVDFFEIPYSSLKEGIISRKNWSDKYYKTQLIEKKLLSKTSKWAGTFLRTSESERLLIEKISTKGVPFYTIADVRFGIKTGANDFFHVKIDQKKHQEKGTFYIRNKLGFEGYIESKYLVPLIKSPLEVEGFAIDQFFSPKVWLFFCNESLKKLRNTKAFEYISWAESVPVKIKQGRHSNHKIYGFSSLSSVKKRALWYNLGLYSPPDLLWTKSYHTKPGCIINDYNVLADQRFYSIIVKKKQYIPLIFIFLNSSFVWAQMEIQGNTNLGFGVLDTNIYWLKSLKIPIDALNDGKRVQDLAKSLKQARKRYNMLKSSIIRKSIDNYFAEYYGLSNNDLMGLNSFIIRTLSNRVNLDSSEV